MIYINIITNANKGITYKTQMAWIKENISGGFRHIGTFGGTNDNVIQPQYNKWRFENEYDALAFKLRWI